MPIYPNPASMIQARNRSIEADNTALQHASHYSNRYNFVLNRQGKYINLSHVSKVMVQGHSVGWNSDPVYWILFYIGHDSEVYFEEFKTKQEAETKMKELFNIEVKHG